MMQSIQPESKQRLLAAQRPHGRLKPGRYLLLALLGVGALVWAVGGDERPSRNNQAEEAAVLAAGLAVPKPGPSIAELAAMAPPEHVKRGTIQRGLTVGEALQRSGLGPEQTFGVVEALRGVFDFRKSRPGDTFEIRSTPDGYVTRFDYMASVEDQYCVERREGELLGFKRELETETRAVMVEGELRSSLFGSIERLGERESLAMLMADVLAWDIDFHRDPQNGDQFKIVVEKVLHEGEMIRYGDILGLEYDGAAVGKLRVFRFVDSSGQAGWYHEDGRSARKALLKAPVPIVRITSSYGRRRHPTEGYSHTHRGVDYGAPTGTPIWAAGDGRITFAGWKGPNGKLVKIRHANGYETAYAHLSKIYVRRGQRVTQKQTIGRVGTTGRSTGPHLHYGMRKHGRFVNPLTVKRQPSKPLPQSEMPAFAQAISPVLARLDGDIGPTIATSSEPEPPAPAADDAG